MTFKEFKIFFESSQAQNKCLRYGQSLMNKLFEIWPEKYKEISGSELDCFYVDQKANKTLEHLEKNWPNEIRH